MRTFSFNSIPDCICIYKIENTITKQCYIGSTTSLSKRIIQHRYDSVNRRYNCPKLYNSIFKYGSDNFNVVILEEFENIDLITLHNKEVEYMNLYNSINNGFNERKDIEGKCITTSDTRLKMSNSGKEVWNRDGHLNHDRKLSKFKYNVYDEKTKELLDEDITIGNITKKYNIASSNIFTALKRITIINAGFYNEKLTVKCILKHCIIERIYIGGTTRDKKKIKINDNNTKGKVLFSF